MATQWPKLEDAVVEHLSRLLSGWESGPTISAKLQSMGMFDNAEGYTKWKRLNAVFLKSQQDCGDCRKIAEYILKVMSPVNFVGQADIFHDRRKQLNEILVFSGLSLNQRGEFVRVEPALSVEESQARANSLRRKLADRNVHSEVLRYCTAEIVANDVFHAVFEACKGLFEAIRSKSGCSEDGAELIDKVFKVDTPILALNSLRTKTEKSEQTGFASLLRGCASACRNPIAHEPRVLWAGTEEDAVDSLMLVSLLMKKLDKCVKVPHQ